ncbi:MAG: hypothetical protein Q7O66_15005, partial [Dehalococcoidia bacterium]|nr:hypothetical protein [Dehalococcoidia bacterium]
DADGLWAARFFWTLEYYGDDKVRVLNGGLKKWRQEQRDLVKDLPQLAKAKFTANPQPNRLATKDQVLQRIGSSGTAIIATVAADEYTGQKVLSKFGGHIPGALNIDWVKNLIAGDVPIMKQAADLDKMYRDAGVTRDMEIIVY